MRKTLAITATALSLLLVTVGTAAAGTTVTMTLVGVSIAEPVAAAWTGAGGALGSTVVTDVGGAGYTVAISSSAFANQTFSGEDIPATSVTACVPATGAGELVLVGGTSAFEAACGGSETAALSTSQTLLTVTGTSGATETGTYSPTILVDDTGASPGVYTGTITQTVS